MTVELSERNTGFDYPTRKRECGESRRGKNTQKTRARTSSYLAFATDPMSWDTVSPDILAPVPRTRVKSNQHNKGVVWRGQSKTTSNSSKSSFHSMNAISKEKLMPLKGSLQHYPYIWIAMSQV